MISTLGVNLRQVEKEAINIHNQIQKDKNNIEQNDSIHKSMHDVQNTDQAQEDSILDAVETKQSQNKEQVADNSSKPSYCNESQAPQVLTFEKME